MRFSYVVLDFDGTFTRVEEVTEPFLHEYRAGLSAALGRDIGGVWDRTLAWVRAWSPQLGWKRGGWEVCPAAPDPYIAASSTAELVLEELGLLEQHPGLPGSLYGSLYPRFAAPFRSEAVEVLEQLVASGAKVCFVSNASTGKIAGRLDVLLPAALRPLVGVVGDAGKFLVRQATEKGGMRGRFDGLPLSATVGGLRRPVVLRRGCYFDALQRLWAQDPDGPGKTIVCGDIFELDLAFPAAMGASVHLIDRAAPYATFDYERGAMRELGKMGGGSVDLYGLLERLREP